MNRRRDLDRPRTEKLGDGYAWFCASMRHDDPAFGVGFGSTAEAADAAIEHLRVAHAEPVRPRPFWSSAASVIAAVFTGLAAGFGIVLRAVPLWLWFVIAAVLGVVTSDDGWPVRVLFGIDR